MEKEKLKGLLLSLVALFTLAACSTTQIQPGQDQSDADNPGQEENDPSFYGTSGHYYRPIIREGAYRPSQSRGITQRLNSPINIKAFESGLMSLAGQHFSTDQHFFEEGQYISSETVRAWVGRESSDNPQGLNPIDNGEAEEEMRSPIYLESVLEQDYYVETENGMQLAGMMIGLAMNSVDYYQAEQYGPVLSQEIPDEDIRQQSQEMIDQILEEVREVDELQDIPIVFAVFKQSPRDSLAGGNYISQVVSPSGSELGEYEQLHFSKLVFPLEGGDTAVAQNFEAFKSEVEQFFPNLSGVTAVGSYQGDQIESLHVDITTQFYGEAEIIAFAQYVEVAAQNYLPTSIPVEITIDSMDDIEAFLYTNGETSDYFSHIFK